MLVQGMNLGDLAARARALDGATPVCAGGGRVGTADLTALGRPDLLRLPVAADAELEGLELDLFLRDRFALVGRRDGEDELTQRSLGEAQESRAEER